MKCDKVKIKLIKIKLRKASLLSRVMWGKMGQSNFVGQDGTVELIPFIY